MSLPGDGNDAERERHGKEMEGLRGGVFVCDNTTQHDTTWHWSVSSSLLSACQIKASLSGAATNEGEWGGSASWGGSRRSLDDRDACMSPPRLGVALSLHHFALLLVLVEVGILSAKKSKGQ